MESTIIVAGIALVIGLIGGALLHKLFQSETMKSRRLESQIDQLQLQHTHYQAEVSRHFSKTAELLGRLNGNYRDIFNHLAQGAEQLGHESEFKVMAGNKKHANKKDAALASLESENMNPPRDYAPKAPEDKGMLSEGFGFKPSPSESESQTDKV